MVAEPVRLMIEALQQLRHSPEPGRIRATEQGHEGDGRPLLHELSRQLERDRATGAVAGNAIGTVGPECPDPLGEVGRQLLDARDGLALAIYAGRLQPEERLILAQLLRQEAEREHVAIVSGHGKHRDALAAGLKRHDGPLPPSQRIRRLEELDDSALFLSQLIAQCRRQDAGRRSAPQLVAFRPDLDLAAAQFLEKGRHDHRTISSRSPASCAGGGVCAFAIHDSPSMTPASPARVGRSKRSRSGTSTPKTSRIRDTALIATSDCPPRSKKSSSTPTCSTLSSSVQMRASRASVSVNGRPAFASGATPGAVGWAGGADGVPSNETAGSGCGSILPFGVRGNASMRTNAAGTI